MEQKNNDNSLTNNMLDKILEKAKKYGVSPYEVGNNTPLTVTGVQKIFDGESKKPGQKSLTAIYDYIVRTYEPEQFVLEQKENYGIQEEITLAKVLVFLERIDAKINALSLKQEIMFEITKNAKAKELEHLNKEFKTKIKR